MDKLSVTSAKEVITHDRQRDGRRGGLTADELAARLTSVQQRWQASREWLNRHLGNQPAWVAWSGGKDSTVVADLAHRHQPGIPIVHFASRLDFPEVTEFIDRTATKHGWNLHVFSTGNVLDEMIANGSWDWNAPTQPDPDTNRYWQHLMVGPASRAMSEFGPIMLWGLRADESAGRRWNLAPRDGIRHRSDLTSTLAPIWWWSRRDCMAYHHAHDIEICPIYRRLAELGVPEREQRVDVIVASTGADRGRLAWLRRGWPDLWDRLAEQLPRMREMS